MSEFQRMPKMATSEPTVTLALKKGGMVKKAMGGSLPMSAPRMPMAPRRPSPGSDMGKPMMDDNMAARAMKQKMMKKARPGMPEAAMPAMKEGGKADMAQDKAMIKKAFKQHDAQEHKGGKGTDLKLKKGGKTTKMATGGLMSPKSSPSPAVVSKDSTTTVTTAPQRGGKLNYKDGGIVSGDVSDKTTRMVTTPQKGGLQKYKKGGTVAAANKSVTPFANTMMHSADNPPNRLGKSGSVKPGQGGYKNGGRVKEMC